MAIIELRGLIKRYGRNTVLDNVDFAISPGITGLLGPNGSGAETYEGMVLHNFKSVTEALGGKWE